MGTAVAGAKDGKTEWILDKAKTYFCIIDGDAPSVNNNMKSNRIEMLRYILTHKEINNQDTLLKELEKAGHRVTQATLSRDLQRLKAAKVVGSDGYRYVLPENAPYLPKITRELPSSLRDTGFKGLEIAGNIVVMRTRAGYANGIAGEIDSCDFDSVAATVAGDDTVLIVIRNGYGADAVTDDLAKLFPVIKSVKL